MSILYNAYKHVTSLKNLLFYFPPAVHFTLQTSRKFAEKVNQHIIIGYASSL